MILKACTVCGKPTPAPYCSKHKPVNRRRQRMAMSGGAWETQRQRAIARDLRCCYLCGRTVKEREPIEVDHLVEVAEGGTNDLSNLATCHRSCHVRRHREPEWAAERIASALKALGGDAPHPGTDPDSSGTEQDRVGWSWSSWSSVVLCVGVVGF